MGLWSEGRPDYPCGGGGYHVAAAVPGRGAIGLLGLDAMTAQVEMDTDVSHYRQYIGEAAEEKYQNKRGMDESIFPEDITEDMDVLEYKMIYYDPWNRQYLGYLVVEYADEAYDAELGRLADCVLDEYAGYYGIAGFDPAYEVLAIDIDEERYNGLVYALGLGEHQIAYVEIIFSKYFIDLDCSEYIDSSHLPLGFDASSGNAQRKEILGHK